MKDDYKINKVRDKSKLVWEMGKAVRKEMAENQAKTRKQERGKHCRKPAATTVGKQESIPIPAETAQPTDSKWRKCGKYNHYAFCWGARPNPQQEKPTKMRKGQVKKTTEADQTSSESDDEYL